MNKILAAILTVLLIACTAPGKVPGYSDTNFNERCIRGVVYYRLLNIMTPAFKQDGGLYLCAKG